jgi:hypothetical protein
MQVEMTSSIQTGDWTTPGPKPEMFYLAVVTVSDEEFAADPITAVQAFDCGARKPDRRA